MSPFSASGREELWLVVVTGWTGAGKSTMADLIGKELDATVASFDWLMSGLRAVPDLWAEVELPVERQRRIGWNLLSRVAEQQLRRGSSCVLDLIAREEPRV
jgi:predicted kinase